MVRGLASFVFLSAVLLYALPSLIAVLRPSRQWPLVVALNILLGWTIVGWSAAFMISVGFRLRKPKAMIRRKLQGAAASKAAPATNDFVLVVTNGVNKPVAMAFVEPGRIHEDIYQAWLDRGDALSAQRGAGPY